MSLGKVLAITAILLFGFLGIAAYFKNGSSAEKLSNDQPLKEIVEVELEQEVKPLSQQQEEMPSKPVEEKSVPLEESNKEPPFDLPEADRINELFSTKGSKLPFVETITYKSRVTWLKGRPAWLSDYASHYETSRHFIARSLNGKADYFKQDITEGAKFNVLKKDVPIRFYLVVDASRCKLWFYAIDDSTHTKTLLKTYDVGLGRPDSTKVSGLLTPLGKYSLGSRVAIYKPGVYGNHKGQKVEMVTVFGTRWIPFEKEISGTAPAKGLGIHGVPWVKQADGSLREDLRGLKDYLSDGCIRMNKESVEEIYAVIVTKPTDVEIVKDFRQSEMAR